MQALSDNINLNIISRRISPLSCKVSRIRISIQITMKLLRSLRIPVIILIIAILTAIKLLISIPVWNSTKSLISINVLHQTTV